MDLTEKQMTVNKFCRWRREPVATVMLFRDEVMSDEKIDKAFEDLRPLY
jgi:hypothetical protein